MANESDELAIYEPTTLSIHAYRKAKPAVRSAPVVAFSHGFFAIRFQSAFLMEHLARHGFVVIATDHPRNTILDFDDDYTVDVLLERPDDIRHSIDEASPNDLQIRMIFSLGWRRLKHTLLWGIPLAHTQPWFLGAALWTTMGF